MSAQPSEILPFVLAGAFLPTWTLMTIALLETSRPVQNSVAFVSGNALFRFALGLSALYVFAEVPVFEISEPAQTPTSVYAFGLAGLAFLALAVRELRHRNEPAGAGTALLDRFERLSPVTSFIAGVAVVAAPGIQWVYFLGGVDVISGANIGSAGALAALLLFVALLQTMLVIPIAVYIAFPATSRARLDSIDRWIRRNSRRTTATILGLLGANLVWRALSTAIAIELL